MIKRLIIKNASEIVTCSGFSAKSGMEMNQLHIIKDGAIVVEDGLIVAVGNAKDLLAKADLENCTVLDAAGKIVLPGFIDSHTHFIFAGDRSDEYTRRLNGEDYMSIQRHGGGILNSVKATREQSEQELINSGYKKLDSMLGFGVTTVEGKSGYGLDIETEIKQLRVMKALNEKHAIDIVSTYMGAHSVPLEYKGLTDDYISFIESQVLPIVCSEKLAEFCDIFCEDGIFSVDQSRRLLGIAKKLGFKLKIHADEIVALGGASLAAEMGAISADHLLMASDEGLMAMKTAGTVATLLPATAFSLREDYARARFMIDNGMKVALATDFNPGSCYTESIPLVIALSTLQMRMSIEEVITALTINGAAALERADKIGSIDVGKAADLVIHDCPSYKHLAYHIGVNSVNTVIKNGEIVKGDKTC